jgi:hypothetical protein
MLPWTTTECLLIPTFGCYHPSEPVVSMLYILSNLISILRFSWAMAHDESRYPDSDAFIPEQFLNDGSLKPNYVEHIAYEFGRRVCIGRHFADTPVWLVIAKVLAVFKILGPLDENGAEIPVEPRFSNGIVVRAMHDRHSCLDPEHGADFLCGHPLPFKYRIVPRFPEMDAEKLEQLIAASHA